MRIIQCMVPEIWSMIGTIFCHFGLLFAIYIITLHMCTINDNHMVYGSWNMDHDRHNDDRNNHMMYGYIWFLKYGVWQTQFYVILEDFLHFHPPNNPKNQNFEKMKKPRRDITTLQLCTINDNHMMYGSWDMECDKHNFLSFWTVFCPFTL